MRIRARFFAVFACAAIFTLPVMAQADTSAQQATLQAQLDQLNQQIAQNQAKLASEQQARATLEDQVAILNSQIKEAQLEIKQRNLTIQQVQEQIAQAQAGISTVNTEVSAGEASLAQIIRETNEINETPLAIQILQGSLPQAFSDVNDFQSLQTALGSSFTQLANKKSDLTAREQTLETENQQESDLLQAQQAQETSLQDTQTQKQNLIAETKGQESIYQQIIANQQQNAKQIEQQLFSLRDTTQTTSFGDIYNYAREASAQTGVDPSFIMGILSEESDLGQNVGTCSFLTAMNPTRDVPVYLQLMQQLGLDPNSEKVSCKPSYGWGGAMGPAQFIPSTWQLYQSRIGSASGQNPPNPWDPRTATFATALYMEDLGANAGGASAERTAALKYFAGNSWRNPSFAFYGNDVMCLTQKMQQQIDVINGQQPSGVISSC
ncbi:MAG TPA: lytic murein transglycosylase [Candidatus Paceibacterota bacterium]|jgi:membrane-bound lytic murein transglycosylase B|nr:lytic murein transglycosylase [Candidatus Paceibacterota bacterium]